MIKRKKVLLSVIKAFGGKLDKVRLMKLMLILGNDYGVRYYDFVPYQQGCFSFTMYDDIRGLSSDYLIEGSKDVSLTQPMGYEEAEAMPLEEAAIQAMADKFLNYDREDLIRYTYSKYPYYASRSNLKQYITTEIRNDIKAILPLDETASLFTIGYEGKSLEEYFNTLIIKNIKILIDVRKNPVSMKYGFSQRILKRTSEKMGIEYVHIPELGIESDKRKKLRSFEDYKELFRHYEQTVIPLCREQLEYISGLISSKKRVALTCFEADPAFCHRSIVAKNLAMLPAWDFPIRNL